jgi:hypothetical protein
VRAFSRRDAQFKLCHSRILASVSRHARESPRGSFSTQTLKKQENIMSSQDPEQDVANTKNAEPDDDAAEPGAERSLEGFESDPPWRVAESLETLRRELNAKFPTRSKVSDGGIGDARHRTSNSDHNPWVTEGAMGIVTARDFTHDPTSGCDAGQLAEKIRSNQDSRVKYVIWNRQIANSSPIGGQPAWAWRPYSGKNPHNHHVHISVKSDKANYDSTNPWNL